MGPYEARRKISDAIKELQEAEENISEDNWADQKMNGVVRNLSDANIYLAQAICCIIERQIG